LRVTLKDREYCIADLDDAIDKGMISVPELHDLIKEKWTKYCDKSSTNNTPK
jgi:dGTP triphosphohydrolase